MKTAMLMALMTMLLMAIGDYFGGLQGMTIMLVFGVVMNFFTYWNSDKMVLAHYRAQEVNARTAPRLYAIVKRLADRAKLPMPKVYVIDSPVPNAFATGRNPEHAAVAVNTALADLLDEDELAGVLAHELSHVKHRDILISTVAASMAGAISTIAQWGMFFGGGRDENGEIMKGGYRFIDKDGNKLSEIFANEKDDFIIRKGGITAEETTITAVFEDGTEKEINIYDYAFEP